MPARGTAFAEEFDVDLTPQEATRALLLQTETFDKLGYEVQPQGDEALVLTRTFVPRGAVLAPLAIGVLIVLLSAASTTDPEAQRNAGRAFAICIGIAIVLGIFAKTTERVDLRIHAREGAGSSILASGTASKELRAQLQTVHTLGTG